MKEKQKECDLAYRPHASKNFRAALEYLLRTEFPRLGGSKVRDMFMDELMALIESHHLTKDRVGVGQVLWYAVHKDDRPFRYKKISQCRMVPVILTLVSPEDIAIRRRGEEKRPERLKRIIPRLFLEAYAQGGVLSAADVSLITGYGSCYISHFVHEYEQEHGTLLPSRGAIHDLGRTVSHKAIICRKAMVDGKQTPEIARETFHDEVSVDRYLLDFDRVVFSMINHGMSLKETCFTTGMSEGLVRQYLELAQELGISSNSLPSDEHSAEDPTQAITVAWLTERLETDSIIEGERREAGGI
jgi:hypothetical protein